MIINAGLNDFLSKPIVREELAAVLYRWAPEKYRTVVEEERKGLPDGPAPTKPAGIVAALAAIPEIDPAVGLANVENQAEIYEEMLRLLADEAPGLVKLMNEQMGRGDLAGLSVQVHGLKSSLASLGAGEISGLARDLEEKSLEGELSFCRDNLPEFLRRLSALSARLAAIFKPEPDRPEGAVSPMSPENDYWADLYQALGVYDFEAIQEALAALKTQEHDQAAAEMLAEVRKKFRGFDYDGAAEIIMNRRSSAL